MRVILATVLVFFWSFLSSANAEDKKPFAIDFTQVLNNLYGKPLPGFDCISDKDKPAPEPGKNCGALTLGDASINALESSLEQDRNEAPIKKFERDQLARLIHDNKAAVLNSEQIALIKDRIGKAFTAAVVGASWPMLDPSLVEKK